MLDELVGRYRPHRICMDRTGIGEKPVEDAKRRYGPGRVEGIHMSGGVPWDLAQALKRRMQDRRVLIPAGSQDLRAALHSVKRAQAAAGRGRPRLDVDPDETDRKAMRAGSHGDEFWALALAVEAASGPQAAAGETVGGGDPADAYAPHARRRAETDAYAPRALDDRPLHQRLAA